MDITQKKKHLFWGRQLILSFCVLVVKLIVWTFSGSSVHVKSGGFE